jgi:hypothetical protein
MPTTEVPSTATIQDQGPVSQCSLAGESKWVFARSHLAAPSGTAQSYIPQHPSDSQSALYPPLKADDDFFPPAVSNSLFDQNLKPSECTLRSMKVEPGAAEGIVRTVPVSLVFETPEPPGLIGYAVSVVGGAARKKLSQCEEAFSLRGYQ